MKRFFATAILIILLTVTAISQCPQALSYQAVIRNANNELIVNANVNVRISVLQGGADGSAVYVETHAVETNGNGLMTIEIGNGNVVIGNFLTLDWAAGPYFLKSEIDPNSGISYSINDVQQLMSVPYAMYAQRAGNAPTAVSQLTNDEGFITQNDVPTNVSQLTNDAGFITAAGLPTNVSQLTNDAGYITASAGLPTNVSQLTNDAGFITAAGLPTNVSQLTNDVGYITANDIPEVTVPTLVSQLTNDAGYLSSYTETQDFGDVLSNCNSASQHQLKNLADPTDAQDAVTKSYLEGVLTTMQNTISNLLDTLNALRNRVAELESNQVSVPIVTTSNVTEITSNSANCGGEVSADGGMSVSARGICWGLSENPTIDDNYTTDGTGIGSFVSQLSALNSATTYYVRAYATNALGTAYGEQMSFTTVEGLSATDGLPCAGAPTVTDHEGNVYNTLMIGNQCWTKENMRCATSPTGKIWIHRPMTNTYKPYYVHETGAVNGWIYDEYIYDWAAAIDYMPTSNEAYWYEPQLPCRGICPQGWHVPSREEWNTMTNYLKNQSVCQCNVDGNNQNIAKALAATQGWNATTGICSVGNAPSVNNVTNFSAVPAGLYWSDIQYLSMQGRESVMWSSSQSSSNQAFNACLRDEQADVVSSNGSYKSSAYSVRCIKD